jgi:CBS domain containing-hemolysin-like protein
MLNFILGLLLAIGAAVVWVLQRTYQHIPAKELKRQARQGDELAKLLYRPVAYGMSLQLLLGMTVVIFGSLSLAYLVQALGVWLAVLTLVVLATVASFITVPSAEVTRSSLWLAKYAAPGIAWLLERLHPVVDVIVRFIRRHRHIRIQTGLYEKADLAEFLERQKHQHDNRIDLGEIALLQHALLFGDKLVSDALVPKRVVKLVAASDSIGPILMNELSKSGHSRFPVYDGEHDNIVGILYLHDLVTSKQTGVARSLMSTQLTYVHENFTLYQTLQAFLKTKRHLFLVVNSFEEFVGIITIEDVIEQMIGKPIVDEFDRYDDLRAVAAAAAKKDHGIHRKDKTEPEPITAETTTEPTEVVK